MHRIFAQRTPHIMPLRYAVYSASWPDAPVVGELSDDNAVLADLATALEHTHAAAGFRFATWRFFQASADGTAVAGDALALTTALGELAVDGVVWLWTEADPAASAAEPAASAATFTYQGSGDVDANLFSAMLVQPGMQCRMGSDDRMGAAVPVELSEIAFLFFRKAAMEKVDATSPKFGNALKAADCISAFPADGAGEEEGVLTARMQRALRLALPDMHVKRAPVSAGTGQPVAPTTSKRTGIRVMFRFSHLPLQRDLPAALHQHAPRLPMFLMDIFGGLILELRAAVWHGRRLCTQTIAVVILHSARGSPEHLQLVSLFYALSEGTRVLQPRYQRAWDELQAMASSSRPTGGAAATSAVGAAVASSAIATEEPLDTRAASSGPAPHAMISTDILSVIAPAGRRVTLTEQVTPTTARWMMLHLSTLPVHLRVLCGLVPQQPAAALCRWRLQRASTSSSSSAGSTQATSTSRLPPPVVRQRCMRHLCCPAGASWSWIGLIPLRGVACATCNAVA